LRKLRIQHLDRDATLDGFVDGFVDRAHSALA
jgi:hypothetical protein